VIEGVGRERFRHVLAELGPDVVFANEDEDRALGGPLPGVAWILKRGENGCSFAGDERPAVSVSQVVDSPGGGDALGAGWIVGGPDLALEAAARCIQTVGSMPSSAG
jgi:sugar/nucleoside kinase (ribokinase family)